MQNLEEKSSIPSLPPPPKKRMYEEIKTSNTSDKSICGVCGMFLFNAIY